MQDVAVQEAVSVFEPNRKHRYAKGSEAYRRMKIKLHGLKAELIADIAKKKGPMLSASDRMSEYGDQAVQSENGRINAGILDIESQELRQIEAALERLEQNKFGLCATCPDDIPENRLEARPWAIKCCECTDKRRLDDGSTMPLRQKGYTNRPRGARKSNPDR